MNEYTHTREKFVNLTDSLGSDSFRCRFAFVYFCHSGPVLSAFIVLGLATSVSPLFPQIDVMEQWCLSRE